MFQNQITPVVKYLLIINVVFFMISTMYLPIFGGSIEDYFILYDFRTEYFKPHQIITYMFLHGGTHHIFSNMLGLFFLGPFLERFIGDKRFLILYFVCGIGAGLLQLGATYLEIPTEILHQLPVPPRTLGASGAVLGVLMAVALLFPNTEVHIYFLFPVKMKYVAGALVAYDLYSGFTSANTGVAHFAHLGGMLFAFILIKFWGYSRNKFY